MDKSYEKSVACLALFGLVETVINPPDRSLFVKAWLAISTESSELSQIASVLQMYSKKLQNNIFSYLEKRGFHSGNVH